MYFNQETLPAIAVCQRCFNKTFFTRGVHTRQTVLFITPKLPSSLVNRPFNARDRDSLIVEQLDRVTSAIHVRGFYKMRQGEELFTYEAYRIRYISYLSCADGELATEQKFVAENDAVIGLFFIFFPMFRQNHGTSPSEMSNDVLLMMSLVSGIATDVVALAECPDSEFNLESYLNDLVTVQDALAFHVCPIRIFKKNAEQHNNYQRPQQNQFSRLSFFLLPAEFSPGS